MFSTTEINLSKLLHDAAKRLHSFAAKRPATSLFQAFGRREGLRAVSEAPVFIPELVSSRIS